MLKATFIAAPDVRNEISHLTDEAGTQRRGPHESSCESLQ